jgi:hypothetical protein
MSLLTRLSRFLFPPSRWQGCHAPTEYERLAAYERRLGEHKAQQWIRNERIAQVFDSATAQRVRPKFNPKLPDENVLPFRKARGR